MGGAIILACVAQLALGDSSVYKLRFLSDYQEGNWNTDAAETVAYDSQTHRAFIGSAQEVELKVVDFSDPTSPEKTGTLNVAADLEFSCLEQDCIYEVMDFGGAGAPCGFADVLKIVHDRPDFSCCGWFDGPFVLDPTMTSPEACQALCTQEPGCEFFSFENECQQGSDIVCNTTSGVRHNECYLKAAFTPAQAADAGFDNEASCFSYVAWEEGPTYDLHAYDPDWQGSSGPVVCTNVVSESVQSVATMAVAGYENTVVAAAVTHVFEWANGYLAFYDAATLGYLGCAPAGNKPEGITSYGNLLSCINEGSAREDGLVDHAGSMTLCDVSVVFNPTTVNFGCSTYAFTEDNFEPSAWTIASEYRQRDVRLYGPNADDIAMDLEPEHGVFVLDGAAMVVSLQDNNGYVFFDTASRKYTYLGGYGYIQQTLDASDDDGYINIKSSWAGTTLYGMPMPDQIAVATIGGSVYILTANEGDTRDGEDIIGAATAADGTDLQGEETRYGDLGSPTVTTCSGCSVDTELGRILTSTFMPSDFATNACGLNSCSAEEMALGLDGDNFECIYAGADYGGFTNGICDFADNPTDAYYVNDPDWVAPSWYSGTVTVDASMTSPQACQALCGASSECDFFSYEFEEGVHECLFKLATDCPLDKYVRWWQHWDDWNWEGYSGPGICSYNKAPYTSDVDSTDISGSPGGSYSVGTRSFTIWRMTDLTTPLELVFDSGSMFEEVTANVANGLCNGCDVAGSNCADRCPFNSDEAPPNLDDRSDAKGPEPESITVGTMSDGTVLAFVGLERTGGIVTYDISNPENPDFQDFLNVRNWLVDGGFEGDDDGAFGDFMVANALNDGPESLVFIDAASSPIGQEMLIAVAPLAGRTTAYIIEKGDAREDDGSCQNTATCPYIPVEEGGEGSATLLTAEDVCTTAESCEALGFPNKFGGTDDVPAASSKKKSSGSSTALIAIVVVLGVLVILALLVSLYLFTRARDFENKYNKVTMQNAMHSDVEIPAKA